ncbi:hypothetical protein K3W29_15005, partial [Listeria monocytogenes]|nr:hypothetical protein [Listeria monocytogenes]
MDMTTMATETVILPALFEKKEDLEDVRARHNQMKAKREKLEDYEGDAYLGIDAGSTTTKLILMSQTNEILYSFYYS